MTVNLKMEGKDKFGNIVIKEYPFSYDDENDPEWIDLNNIVEEIYSRWIQSNHFAPMTSTFIVLE